LSILDRTSQAIDSAPVTASDTVDIVDSAGRRRFSDGISCAVAGNITYIPAGVSEQGAAATLWAGAAAGVIHPIRASRIMATGTAATGLTAFFT